MDIRYQQENIETQFNRRLIRERIKIDVDTTEGVNEWLKSAVELFEAYRNQTYTYASKNERMAHLRTLEAFEIVQAFLYISAEFQKPELLVSVAAQMQGILGFEDQVAGVTTAAEIIAVLAPLNAWEVYKETIASSIKFVSLMPLSDKTNLMIAGGMVLPPMICKPDTLESNYDSGYLTHVESLILGARNHHNEELGLDVLNTMNSVKLSLCPDFIEACPEEPTFVIKDEFQAANWNAFMEQSLNIYQMLLDTGNQFHLTHKVDKRGRIYCSGYHINTQGTSFKKASLDLAKKEQVSGVPSQFQL